MRTRKEQLSAMARVGDREDIAQWQRDQKEFFDPCILSIVEEYAAWRDKQEAECAADTRRLEWLAECVSSIGGRHGEPLTWQIMFFSRSGVTDPKEIRAAIDAAMEGGKQ